MQLQVDSHPRLVLGAFTTTFPRPLGEMESPPWLLEWLALDAEAPFARSEDVRAAVRDLLRSAEYKPTGRGKPASEYLVRSAEEGQLTGINPAVDACNAVSLQSGLPISVVDLDRAEPPLRVGPGSGESRYIFNASGQEIRVAGLLCLHDAGGPCANAVKDAQRTKTGQETRRTLSLVWGSRSLGDLTARATAWYREILERLEAATGDVELLEAKSLEES